MRQIIAIVIALAFVSAVPFGAAAQAPAKRDTTGPVTVAVTPLAASTEGTVKVKVVLDTHSVGLEGIAFDKVVLLRTGDGREVAAKAIEDAAGSGHHRSAVVVFAAPTDGALRVVVRNVGGVAERAFAWEPWPAR